MMLNAKLIFDSIRAAIREEDPVSTQLTVARLENSRLNDGTYPSASSSLSSSLTDSTVCPSSPPTLSFPTKLPFFGSISSTKCESVLIVMLYLVFLMQCSARSSRVGEKRAHKPTTETRWRGERKAVLEKITVSYTIHFGTIWRMSAPSCQIAPLSGPIFFTDSGSAT